MQLDEEAVFEEYLRGVVKARFDDEELEELLADELANLASSGMESGTLEEYVSQYEAHPDNESWKIGEALAECILRDRDGATLPWNKNRDEQKPRVSLPGTDIVGFMKVDGKHRFLFGETKTSHDTSNLPPSVMTSGEHCMKRQLLGHLEEDQRKPVHSKLVRWLLCRVVSTEYHATFVEALESHQDGDGHDFVLVGILLRDTEPEEEDIKGPSKDLSAIANAPTKVKMEAVYLPVSIEEWPQRLRNRL